MTLNYQQNRIDTGHNLLFWALGLIGLDLASSTGVSWFYLTKFTPAGEYISFAEGLIASVKLGIQTLPLFMSVAIFVAISKSSKSFNPITLVLTIIGCGLVSNLLHLGVGLLETGGVPFPPPMPHSESPSSGFGTFLNWAFGFLQAYYSGYGIVLFIKSCILGCRFGFLLAD